MQNGCSLCRPDLEPLITTTPAWHLVLNHNQNLLGKCFLALTRHEERVVQLTAAEWAELHRLLAGATAALQQLFRPDHFNYAFLQNQDRHVHLHIIPRYAETRTFAGLAFDDPDYPDHYAVPAPQRHLPEAVLETLAQQLRQLMLPNGFTTIRRQSTEPDDA